MEASQDIPPSYEEADVVYYSPESAHTIIRATFQAPEPLFLPPRTPTGFRGVQFKLKRLSKRLLHGNPGFCPGAWAIRRQARKSGSVYDSRYNECAYCGRRITHYFPASYVQDWPDFQRYNKPFIFENHVPVKRRDNTERRGCILCWEHDGVWAEPMDISRWGAHMRKHFKEDGYWMCTIDAQGLGFKHMAHRSQCPATKCRGVHS